MQPTFAHSPEEDHFYHVTPDEIDQLVKEPEMINSPNLKIDTFQQYAGRNVYAMTFTDPAGDPEGKIKLFVSRPHAHEPAGVAASAELAKSLAGYEDYADHNAEWREWVLANFVITLVPDANPGGSQRSPVKFWDGVKIPNEQFFLWMFGESGATPGERFPRVASWDMRKVIPPRLLGIAYEQIEEHIYVEPNRDYRSTFFQSFFKLDKIYHYHLWMDLHQTEFLNSDRNAQINLPTCYDDLPKNMQKLHSSLGKAIHARWRQEGGSPHKSPVVSYRRNKTQRDFLSRVWLPISKRMIHIVTEVQNNNARTPVPLQVHLQLTAVLEAMGWIMDNYSTY